MSLFLLMLGLLSDLKWTSTHASTHQPISTHRFQMELPWLFRLPLQMELDTTCEKTSPRNGMTNDPRVAGMVSMALAFRPLYICIHIILCVYIYIHMPK